MEFNTLSFRMFFLGEDLSRRSTLSLNGLGLIIVLVSVIQAHYLPKRRLPSYLVFSDSALWFSYLSKTREIPSTRRQRNPFQLYWVFYGPLHGLVETSLFVALAKGLQTCQYEKSQNYAFALASVAFTLFCRCTKYVRLLKQLPAGFELLQDHGAIHQKYCGKPCAIAIHLFFPASSDVIINGYFVQLSHPNLSITMLIMH